LLVFDKVVRNDIRAWQILQQMQESGKARLATAMVAALYFYGNCCGISKNLDTAKRYAKEVLPWLRERATEGDPHASYFLGIFYQYGIGMTRDLAGAARLYLSSAQAGYAVAQNNLGICYSNGEGVPKDYAESARWYRLAADQGLSNAQNSLGNLYKRGNGLPINFAEAVRWFRMSADQEHSWGQYNLGICYKNGEGVRVDLGEARRLFELAASQGNNSATEELQQLKLNASTSIFSRMFN
jgi:TPR repeat protein